MACIRACAIYALSAFSTALPLFQLPCCAHCMPSMAAALACAAFSHFSALPPSPSSSLMHAARISPIISLAFSLAAPPPHSPFAFASTHSTSLPHLSFLPSIPHSLHAHLNILTLALSSLTSACFLPVPACTSLSSSSSSQHISAPGQPPKHSASSRARWRRHILSRKYISRKRRGAAKISTASAQHAAGATRRTFRGVLRARRAFYHSGDG